MGFLTFPEIDRLESRLGGLEPAGIVLRTGVPHLQRSFIALKVGYIFLLVDNSLNIRHFLAECLIDPNHDFGHR